MKIIHALPPIYDAVLAAGLNPSLGHVLFSYGDTLYIPSGLTPSPEILAHENTHSIQQLGTEGGVDAWWERYLDDVYFRITQETEAYVTQYKKYCTLHKDRNAQARYMQYIGSQLSGPLYGNVIGHSAAIRMVREQL